MRVVVTPSAQDRFNFGEQFPWRSDDIVNLSNGFDPASGIASPRSFRQMLDCLPAGWDPDAFVHWSLEYTPVPEGVEEADCLTAAVVGDWNLGGQAVQLMGGAFDLLIADQQGCRWMRSAGFQNVRYAPLWSFDPTIHRRMEGVERDIDILMVGSFNHDVQHERARWLARVAKLSDKYRVCLTAGVHGEDYTRLMNRAKIVFNRSIRGEINMRAYEAPACGALLFYERENEEVGAVYRDREECVLYSADDLEDLVAYYLEHEDERKRIAEAGWRRVQQETTAHHFARILDILEEEAGRRDRAVPRPFLSLPPAERDLRRLTQWVVASPVTGAAKAQPLLATVANQLLNRADALNADACARFALITRSGGADMARELHRATDLLSLAVAQDPSYATGRLNLALAMRLVGCLAEAEELIEETLRCLQSDTLGPGQVRGPYLPRRYDAFDVEMEAAWSADALDSAAWAVGVRNVLLWRAYELRAEMAADAGRHADAVEFALLAVRLKPHIARTRALLARSLRFLGRGDEALDQYRWAYADSPLKAEVWLDLLETLCECGQPEEAGRLAAELMKIVNASPPYESLRIQVSAYLEPDSRALAVPGTYACFPEWSDVSAWSTTLRRYVQSFGPSDATRLLLFVDRQKYPALKPVLDALERYVIGELRLSPEDLPEIELVHHDLESPEARQALQKATAILPAGSTLLPPAANGLNLPIIPVESIGLNRTPAARNAA
jgi:tetratricopeptide (TPR) repeat protein